MPINIKKLSEADASRYFPKRSSQDVSEYVQALTGLKDGDVAEVGLDGTTVRALKRRLTSAGKQLGLTLKYAKDEDGALRFKVSQQRQAQSIGNKRGRPPKSTA